MKFNGNTKNKTPRKTQSQRENDLRPKLAPPTLAVSGILSSCPRVMTMQCWKSQIPPPLSTRLRAIVGFWFCADQKERKHDSAKFPNKIKTQRQVKSQHCTLSPKSPKFQEYQNHYPKSIKILQNQSKSIKIHETQKI